MYTNITLKTDRNFPTWTIITYFVQQSEEHTMHGATMKQLIKAEICIVWETRYSEWRPWIAGTLIQPVLFYAVHKYISLFHFTNDNIQYTVHTAGKSLTVQANG